MSWIAIVMWVLRYAPDLIGLIQTILNLIHTLPKGQQLQALQELHAAHATGSPQAVAVVAQKWEAQCKLGTIGCGGGLVTDESLTPPPSAGVPLEVPPVDDAPPVHERDIK